MSDTKIHPLAVIENGAELDSDVIVGPFSVIGKHVKIAKGTIIHSNVVIQGHTTIGCDNIFYSFCAIGNPPQDLKYKGEPTLLEIGDKNTVREFVTINTGTVGGGGKTQIGHENLLMATCHIAHDCIVGHQNVIANGVLLAGHVTIGNMTVLGGASAFHQFVTVGDMAMSGGGAMVIMDAPPYSIVEGNRATLRGINNVALQRRGISLETRTAIKSAYKILFHDSYASVEEAILNLSEELLVFPEIKNLVEFVRNSKRGVVRP